MGVVSLSAESYVGVCIGEVDLWGEGIGSAAVEWLCDTHDRDAFFAEIHSDNEASQCLFQSCGFTRHEEDEEWITYRIEG